MFESTPEHPYTDRAADNQGAEVIEDETMPLEDLNPPTTSPRRDQQQYNKMMEDAASASNFMMSPPQSHAHSVIADDQQEQQMLNRDAVHETQSLDASIRSANQQHRTAAGAPFSAANMNVMSPEMTPQMESALSQKQFIIKKQSSRVSGGAGGPHKRANSKGPGAAAGHLKAYFPKLIKTQTSSVNNASRAVDGVTPTNGGGSTTMSYQNKPLGGGSGSARQRKYGKMSRSQHGGSSSHHTGGPMSAQNAAHHQKMLVMQQQLQMNGSSGGDAPVFLPTDLSNQVIGMDRNPMESTSRSLIIVDDYQRQAIGLSQEAQGRTSHGGSHVPLRKQRSQVRGALVDPRVPVRRNSFAEATGTATATTSGHQQQAAKNNRDGRGMLPPIFSGPQKKNSQKAKVLGQQKNQQVSQKQQQQLQQYNRSQLSDSSPIQYKSETGFATGQVMAASERQSVFTNNEMMGQAMTEPAADEDEEEKQAQTAAAKKGQVNFVNKNQERLRQMQEQRALELKNIEEQRLKVQRRQEKIKQKILMEAQAYKAIKAQRSEQNDQQEAAGEASNGIKLGNMKNQNRGQTSPPRSTANVAFGAGVKSPTSQEEAVVAANNDVENTEEEKAEEKKKFDMMRKFYRNRHTSFLQALAEQKAKKEQEDKAIQDKQEMKKQKIKQKVVGDGTQIRSKLFEPKVVRDDPEALHEVPPALANLNSKQLNSTSKSSNTTTTQTKKKIRRGNSVSALSQADKAYNDSTTMATSSGNKIHRQGVGSRGSSRAASSHVPSERKTMQRSESGFSRGRIASSAQQNQKNAAPVVVMTAEEQLEFDEKREQEILQEAAAKKARAQAIKERNEKQLAAIKSKVASQKEKEQEKENRMKKMQDQAREAVVQRAEEIKNMPSLRDQQDSRLKKRRNDEDGKQVTSPSPGKPKAAAQDSEAFNNFLERNKTYIKSVQLNITDMQQWKKRNRVDADTKVFIIKGGYGDVKRALKERGWVENKEKDSPCYDFLWTLMTKDVQHNSLQSHQIVNHFPTATSITTKVGLTHSLKNLIWFNSVDIDTFYPRCYDLALKDELDDFIQEFKQVKAVSYLKIYVREMREAFAKSGNSASEEIKSSTVTEKIYKVAMKVCKQRTRDLDDLIDDPSGFESLVTDREWNILRGDEHTEESLAAFKHERRLKKMEEQEKKAAMGKAPQITKKKQKEARDLAKATREASKAKAAKMLKERGGDDEVDEEGDEDDEDYEYDQEYDDEDGREDAVETQDAKETENAKETEDAGDEYDDEYGDYGDEDNAVIAEDKPKTNAKSNAANKIAKEQEAAQAAMAEDFTAKPAAFAQSNQTQAQKDADAQLSQRYPKFADAIKVLDLLREKYPQINLDGERNIWILKPAGSSRGRGICLKRDLCEILDLIKFKDSNQLISNQSKSQLYICQKYIENSLIMKCRKFDIRQWVLVTDWNPLTIWIYAEPYIRFPAADFDFNKISNRYAHLSNNSIAKYGHKVTVTHKIEGNMWDLEQFQSYLQQTYGFDVWEDKIVEGIRNIVINSLESVQDNFEMKKGVPFEMFGYDVMVDDDFNCWLIEVNSSPAMDYSTDVTERLVKMVLEDTVKVVIDHAQAPPKKQKKVDTGGFECVYKAKRIVEKPLNSFGLNMEVHGRKIPKAHLKKY